ncbi:MAG: hypothetical protein LIO46_07340 [Clostridiales bacterium]|nr:hypothetical protein [Clostridiales bacterium]
MDIRLRHDRFLLRYPISYDKLIIPSLTVPVNCLSKEMTGTNPKEFSESKMIASARSFIAGTIVLLSLFSFGKQWMLPCACFSLGLAVVPSSFDHVLAE